MSVLLESLELTSYQTPAGRTRHQAGVRFTVLDVKPRSYLVIVYPEYLTVCFDPANPKNYRNPGKTFHVSDAAETAAVLARAYKRDGVTLAEMVARARDRIARAEAPVSAAS